MSSSLRSCLFLLFVFAFLAGTTRAQAPFTILETGVQRIFTNSQDPGSLYVHIENLSSSQIWLTADVSGGQKFGLHPSHRNFSIYPDSTFRIRVVYFPVPGDTSQGFLVVRDSLGYSDTLEIWGMDSRPDSPVDRWIGYFSDLQFGSYYWKPDSLNVTLQNKSADTIDITATILSGAYGITLSGDAQRTVYPNEMERFRFAFDSQGHDSGYARVVFSSTGESDTVDLIARNIGDTLYWDWRKDYYNVPAGDTLCQEITIINFNSRDAYISAFTFAKGEDFYLSNGPSLPYLIEAGDSLNVSVCYVSRSANTFSADGLAITFQFPDQASRTTSVGLYGSSLECELDADRVALDYGKVPPGTTAWEGIWIRNRHNMTVKIDSISFGGDQRFSTNVQFFPVTIPPLDSARIDIRFIPGSSNDTAGYAVFYSKCTVIYTDLIIDVSDNDSSIALYGDQSQSIGFFGDSSYSTVVYKFYNDQQDSITVLSVLLAQGDQFSITNIQPSMPEFKLGPEDEMSVTVQFIGNPGTYNDTLVIVTENGVVALRFPIDAVISGSDVDQRVNTMNLGVKVFPNPSSGMVNFDVVNGRATSIEVLDMLGAVVQTLTAQSTRWDGHNMSPGTYFIRVTGVSDSGQPFVRTQRVVIE